MRSKRDLHALIHTFDQFRLISTNPLTLALSPALAKPELALAAHCEYEDHIQLCDYVTSAL